MLDGLVESLCEINNPAQLWGSPLMCVLYAFAYCKASNDRDAYPLQDASKFPFPYLGLLWSTRWINEDGVMPYKTAHMIDDANETPTVLHTTPALLSTWTNATQHIAVINVLKARDLRLPNGDSIIHAPI